RPRADPRPRGHGRRASRTGLVLEEHGERGGEAVQERLAAHGADLARAEEARDRVVPEQFRDGATVVVGLVEHARAATVAGEEERPGRTLAVQRRAEALAQVGVGGGSVADVEAERLAD